MTPQPHGLTMQLILGEQLPCLCCYEVEAHTVISLPEKGDTQALVGSLVAHAGCQIALFVKQMAPGMTNAQLGEFLAEHIAQGLRLVNAGGSAHAK